MNTKRKIIIMLFLVLMNICYSQVSDTTVIAYVAVQSYEIEDSTISKIINPKISDYQGSYHFGESEGES